LIDLLPAPPAWHFAHLFFIHAPTSSLNSSLEQMVCSDAYGQRKYAEAEPLLLEGYRGMESRKDRIMVADRNHLDRARVWIVKLYQAWSKAEKAAEWKL
jgi:hypothetical protein